MYAALKAMKHRLPEHGSGGNYYRTLYYIIQDELRVIYSKSVEFCVFLTIFLNSDATKTWKTLNTGNGEVRN